MIPALQCIKVLKVDLSSSFTQDSANVGGAASSRVLGQQMKKRYRSIVCTLTLGLFKK